MADERSTGAQAQRTDPRTGAVATETRPAPNQPPQTGRDNGRKFSYKIAKLTLRLDRERHLKFKIFAAHPRMSMQRILVLAIDAYMAQAGRHAGAERCACLNEIEARLATFRKRAKAQP